VKFRVQLEQSEPISQLVRELPARFDRIGLHLAKTLAQHALNDVKRRIPNKGGWYLIYRQALAVFGSGRQLVAAGYANLSIPVVPSATGLISFDNSTPVARVLSPYNPWPIDLIPPVRGGYDLDVVVTATSESAVEAERSRLGRLVPIIRQALTAAGATLESETASVWIRGNLYTDIPFLASVLEKTRPHWSPAAQNTLRSGLSRGAREADNVTKLMLGQSVSSDVVPEIPPDVRRIIRGA